MKEKISNRQQIQTVCLVILTTIALAMALRELAPVLVPFVLAVFITLGMSLLIDLMMRYLHIPRVLAMILTVIVGLLILLVLVLLISSAVDQLMANAETYEEQITFMIEKISKAVPALGIGENTEESLMSGATIRKVLLDTGTAVMNIVSQGVLVLIFVIFLLSGQMVSKRPVGGVLGEAEAGIK
ncbi:MAG: AI-2E family transporter, partial [bacterium]|nr:AI-2E family transporter [bacterium]